jgi:hypothetical protein
VITIQKYKKVKQLPDGHLVILGMLNNNYFLRKTDLSGNEIWMKELSDQLNVEYEPVKNIVIDFESAPDGTFIIAGHSNSYNPENNIDYNLFAKRLNENGEFTDSAFWSGISSEYCKSVTTGTDGSVYIAGVTSFLPPLFLSYLPGFNYFEKQYNMSSSTRCFLLKADPDLDLVWNKTFGNEYGSEAVNIFNTGTGNFLLTGNQIGYRNKNVINFFTTQIDGNGNINFTY